MICFKIVFTNKSDSSYLSPGLHNVYIPEFISKSRSEADKIRKLALQSGHFTHLREICEDRYLKLVAAECYSTFLRFAFYLEDNKMSNEHSDHFIPPLALINIGTRIAKNCLYSFKNAMNYVHNEIWRHLDVIGLYMTPIML